MNKDKVKYSEELADTLLDVMTKGESVRGEEKLHEWMVNNPYAADKLVQLADEAYLADSVKSFKQDGKQKNVGRLGARLRAKQLKRRVGLVSAVAAAVLFVSFAVYYATSDDKDAVVVATVLEEKVVEKSGDVPMLYTSEGEYEILDTKTGDSAEKEIVKLRELVAYETIDIKEETVKYSRMVVPSEHTVRVELSDGTVVMLNANSELYFPDRFSTGERSVELIGEGYFEVAKSSDKFIVLANGVEVNVYGTKFNVNAYKPNSVETILVEGSVGVKMKGVEAMLKPNELCVSDIVKGTMLKQDVVVAKYIAWADGVFMMEKDSFAELAHQLSKWYGVDFIIENEAVRDMSVSTILSKESSLQDAIDMLQLLNYDVEIIKTERGYVIR